MAINFLNSIDLNVAELQNARIQNLTTNPGSPSTLADKLAQVGRVYFNTNSSQTLKIYAQTGFTSGSETFAWQDVGGTVTLTGDVTGGPGTTIATTISDDVITFDMFTTGIVEAITGTGSTDKIATTAGIVTYVNSRVTGLLEFKGGFNATTGVIDGGSTNLTYDDVTVDPNVPRIAIEVGDYYVVTTAGNFFGNSATALTPGDSVIVQTDAAAGASVEADFVIVQSDTDLATLTTVGLGNVNNAASTASMVITYSSGTASIKTNSETHTITGDGSAEEFKFLSTLGANVNMISSCQEVSTGEVVYVGIKFANVTVGATTGEGVTVTFATPPANNKLYKLTVTRAL